MDMSSHSIHQNFTQEPFPSYPVQYSVDRKSPCPQCCQTYESRGYHHAVAHSNCNGPQSSCDCGYNATMCSRQQHCCPSLSNITPTFLQSCECQVPPNGFRRTNCSCPQQQNHQGALVAASAYAHTSYPVLPVQHLPPGTVSFSPLPIAGTLAFPQVVSAIAAQSEIIPSRPEETLYQRHMGDAGSSLEDSSHYHTHIHHHIHRYQHYPFSCVSIGHHHLPAMTVPTSHSNQARHHWRHIASRTANAPYPYMHLPFHYHPYRVVPSSSIQRATGAPAFITHGTIDLDHEDTNLDWNSSENQSSEPRGLTKLEIEQLPTYIYDGDEKRSSESTRCVVCICDFEPDDNLRILPCAHEFHSKCVDRWLKTNPTCPICRALVNVAT